MSMTTSLLNLWRNDMAKSDAKSCHVSMSVLGLHFGLKKTGKISIVFEDLSRILVFFRTEVKPKSGHIDSLWNEFRNMIKESPLRAKSSRQYVGSKGPTTASGSSPLTCRMGAPTDFATSEGYRDERAEIGSVVKPTLHCKHSWRKPCIPHVWVFSFPFGNNKHGEMLKNSLKIALYDWQYLLNKNPLHYKNSIVSCIKWKERKLCKPYEYIYIYNIVCQGMEMKSYQYLWQVKCIATHISSQKKCMVFQYHIYFIR